jgi:HK97 family phage portal protein
MTLRERISKYFLGSPSMRAFIWGRGTTDYSKWDKRKMVEQGYERNPVFAAIVDRVADLVSHVPVYVEYRGRNGKKETTYEHPILDALDRSDTGRKALVQRVASYLMVTGEGYLQKEFTEIEGNKRPLGFIVLPSQYTNPIQGTYQNPISAFEILDKSRVRLEVDEVVYIRKPSLSEYFHGTSYTTALAEVLDYHNYAITWNKNIAMRGGIPPLIAEMEGITQEQAQEWKEKWIQVNGGANNQGVPAVSDSRDVKFSNFATKPNEADFVKGIEMATRMIAMRTGFPSELLNDPSGKTYANVAEATKTLYRDIVVPMAEMIYGSITRDCRDYYKDKPFIRIDEEKIPALQEDRKALIERLTVATGRKPILTQNEAREEMKLGKLEGESYDTLGGAIGGNLQDFTKPNETVILE